MRIISACAQSQSDREEKRMGSITKLGVKELHHTRYWSGKSFSLIDVGGEFLLPSFSFSFATAKCCWQSISSTHTHTHTNTHTHRHRHTQTHTQHTPKARPMVKNPQKDELAKAAWSSSRPICVKDSKRTVIIACQICVSKRRAHTSMHACTFACTHVRTRTHPCTLSWRHTYTHTATHIDTHTQNGDTHTDASRRKQSMYSQRIARSP